MACADFDMDIHGADEDPSRSFSKEEPVMRYYQASELLPERRGPLHDLLQKQPAVLGSLQMVSGMLSVGIGILFAVTQEMNRSFMTLFRLSHLTGSLFFIAGLISNLLFKYPRLLPVSFGINCGCIAVSVVAACLMAVDLSKWNQATELHLKLEVLELCVLGLEVFLSSILCFWFAQEKQNDKSPKSK